MLLIHPSIIKTYNIKQMTKNQYNYSENMIKGRIAETLIEELFTSMDYEVFRYGMENTIPGIRKKLKASKPEEVATELRKMPDFVIKHPVENTVHFVEVKFRASESFSFKDVGLDYPYKNTYFIVVSKKHIKCLTYAELQEGKFISPKCRNYLGSRDDMSKNKQTIIDFCKFALKFFECI